MRDAAAGAIGLVERLTGRDITEAGTLPDLDNLLTKHRCPSDRIPDAVRALATASTEAAALESRQELAGACSAALAWVLLAVLAGPGARGGLPSSRGDVGRPVPPEATEPDRDRLRDVLTGTPHRSH